MDLASIMKSNLLDGGSLQIKGSIEQLEILAWEKGQVPG